MCVCVCAHESSAFGGHKRVLDLLKVELQGVLSCLTWMLEEQCLLFNS